MEVKNWHFFCTLITLKSNLIMETHYKKIYTGNFIVIQLLAARLEEIGINPIVKDESHLGLSAVGVSDYQGEIDLYVHENESEKAGQLVEATLAQMKSENKD